MRILKIGLFLGLLILSLVANWFLFRDVTEHGIEKFLPSSSIDRIILEKENSKIDLEKKENSWNLVNPFVWPVNVFAVRKFLSTLKNNHDTLPQNTRIQLFHQGEIIETIQGGNSSVDLLQEERWNRYWNPYFWLEGVRCPLEKDDIQKIIFEDFSKKKRYVLAKRDKREWYFIKPYEIPADGSKVEILLKQWTAMEWLPNFLAVNSAAEKAALTVTLKDRERHIFTIYFSFPDSGNHKAWLDASAITVDFSDKNNLLGAPEVTLIDWEKLLPIPQSLQFYFSKKNLILAKDEEGCWSAFQTDMQGKTKIIPSRHVQKILNDFQPLSPIGIVPETPINTNSAETFEVLINEEHPWTFFVIDRKAYGKFRDAPYQVEFPVTAVQKIFLDLCHE